MLLVPNNLVQHVHVLYFNVGTKWMKNHAWGPTWGGWLTPQVCQMDHPNTSRSCVQNMDLFGQNGPVAQPTNFGQLSSILVWSQETHNQVSS